MSSCSRALTSDMSTDRPYPKPERRRSDSGELDVFEAARYFSGGIDDEGLGDGRALREEKVAWKAEPMPAILPQQPQKVSWKAEPMRTILPQQPPKVDKQQCKQPSSPGGGRLSTFLTSLFNQSASRKKSASIAAPDDRRGQSRGAARKRSSSIDGKRISRPGESTAFRTTGSYPTSPSKMQKDRRPNSVAALNTQRDVESKSIDGFLGKSNVLGGGRLHGIRFEGEGLVCSVRIVENRWVLSRVDGGSLKDKAGFASKEKGLIQMDDDDDNDDESDSSSDLFELKNYELASGRSSALHIHGTTDREKEDAIASVAS